jgi:uncharacterized membrane protein YozB (DUF420 family)
LSADIIVLHAGTPISVSQATLTVMLVVLGIALVGIGFGLAKNKVGFLQHRWSMTAAVALALTVILAVMLPTTYTFYTDPDLEALSSLSIVTFIHAVAGVPTVVLGLLYAFGDLPAKTKKWMRYTAVFWVVSVGLGVLVFLVMQDLLLTGM